MHVIQYLSSIYTYRMPWIQNTKNICLCVCVCVSCRQVTATAFIYVDREMSDIKTIIGNKMSGCGADALGFALYVNEWNKKDGQLWLEWGDGARGCQKVHKYVS